MVSGGGSVSKGAVGGASDAMDTQLIKAMERTTTMSKLPILTAFLIPQNRGVMIPAMDPELLALNLLLLALGSSLHQIQDWTTVRGSYSRALEQGPLPGSGP